MIAGRIALFSMQSMHFTGEEQTESNLMDEEQQVMTRRTRRGGEGEEPTIRGQKAGGSGACWCAAARRRCRSPFPQQTCRGHHAFAMWLLPF
jgi:hypothetical protein